MIFFFHLCKKSFNFRKRYNDADTVPIYFTKFGIKNNTLSQHPFFNFCQTPNITKYNYINPNSFSRSILGYNFDDFHIESRFERPAFQVLFCSEIIESETIHYIIENNLQLQMFADDLLFWIPFGKKHYGKNLIYTQYDIFFEYNNNSIISVYGQSKNPQEISKAQLKFSVEWHETAIRYKNRHLRSQELNFFQNPLHTKSLLLSFSQCAVVLLLILIILHIIISNSKSDLYLQFMKNTLPNIDNSNKGSDSIWPVLSSDVFRPPSHSFLLSVFASAGFQNAFILFCFGISNIFIQPQHVPGDTFDMFLSVNFISILPTSLIIGLYSNIFSISDWSFLMISSFLINIFSYFILILFCNIPFIHALLNYSKMIRIIYFLLIILISIFFVFCIKKTNFYSHFPYESSKIPRKIPKMPWHLSDIFLIPFMGLICSIPLYSELFFVISAIWFGKIYYIFNFFTASIAAFLFLSSGYSFIIIYYRFENENYKWHWITLLGPSFSGVFVFIYEVFFFFSKCHISETIEIVKYFLISLWIAFMIGSAAGGISYLTSTFFVRHMFSTIKMD